jgi:hypothetical protein
VIKGEGTAAKGIPNIGAVCYRSRALRGYVNCRVNSNDGIAMADENAEGFGWCMIVDAAAAPGAGTLPHDEYRRVEDAAL